MNKLPGNIRLWLPLSVIAFICGMLTFGVISGHLTGAVEAELEQSKESGYTQGYAQGVADSPTVQSQTETINIISGGTFVDSLEIELKAISRASNGIDFTYGEVGRNRQRVSSLNVGDAIAYRAGHNLYVIKNVSVSANLQRSTIEVIRVVIP